MSILRNSIKLDFTAFLLVKQLEGQQKAFLCMLLNLPFISHCNVTWTTFLQGAKDYEKFENTEIFHMLFVYFVSC